MLNKGEKVRNRKKCAEDGGCVFGKHDQANTVTLNTILTEGSFVISVFYDLAEEEKNFLEMVGKVDMNLHIGIEGLVMKEDRFNCEAARLPDSLDFLLDFDGFLKYSDWVFADFGKKKQSTVFNINKPSVFRMVTVEPSGVDVDLTLYTQGNVIAKSNAVGGSEGILIELEKGTYALDISFANSFIEESRKKFCETVLVEIGISPQEAVKEFNKNFDLNSCQDTTENLLKWFDSINEQISKEKVQLNTANTFYTLPISNLAESEEKLFSANFKVPKMVYAYFEIFSDFVTSGLSITLSKSSKSGLLVLKGSDNALNLGEHSRRTFALTLKPGTYTFNILSSAASRVLNPDGDTYKPYNSASDYKLIQPCVAFQLRIQLIPTSSKAMDNWECKDVEFKLLPKSLNTLDKLGIKNTPSSIMPPAVYYSQAVAAPNSFNNVTDSSLFYIESESIIRVLVESEDSPMIISLFKGDDLLSESKDQKNFIYGINAVLEQRGSYRLQFSYFPSSSRCHTYSVLLEIISKSRVRDEKKECSEVSLSEELVSERLLEIGGIFEFILEDGVSSINLEPEFSYKQRKTPYEGLLDLEITAESALVTGHLLLNFGKTNLIMEILSEGEVIEWGSFKSLSRYELDPIPLTQGNYQIRIRELVPSPVSTCSVFKGSVLMEDIAFWNDVSSMIKTTEACNFPDLPEDLGLIGVMKENAVEWSQNLPIDSYLGQSFLEFTVTEQVVFTISVAPVRNIEFFLRVSKYLDTEVLVEAEKTVSGLLGQGTYLIEILYESDFGLPSPSLCQTFPITVSILPSSLFDSRSIKPCKKSHPLPQSLQSNFDRPFEIFGQLDSLIKIQLFESSQIEFFAGFDFILSGTVHMELLDNNKKLLKISSSQYAFSHLSMSVPSGDYFLRIWSEKAYKEECWELNFSFSHAFSEVCLGAVLPESLSTAESAPFGGPQGADGSISFSGRFSIDKNTPEQILKFDGKGDSIVRVLTVTRGKFRIESGVYQTNLFNSPIGYSKNKSKYSSYVFQIQSQESPYFLVLNHIIEENKGCMLYDLKIVIKPVSSVSEQLKCKILTHENKLPPTTIDLFSSWSFDNENLAIFDKWMIGNQLPEGVISTGKKNSKFVFSSILNIKKSGYLSSEAVYDYLTNDLTIEIWNEESLLGSSNWDNMIDEDFKELSKISSTLQELYLVPGQYKMLLTQGLVANHLIQKFPDQSSCFPFGLYLEFTPKVMSKNNKLMSVIPPEHKSHNTLQNLVLILKFSKPISEKKSVFLLKSSDSTLIPDEITIDSDSNSRVRLRFLSTALVPNTCYDLIIESENLDSDGLLHQYCTSACKCNPSSEAQCINKACVCPTPYTGPECFECEEGHLMEKNTCINTVDENPKVLSVKLNTQTSLKKNHQLRVYINLSSAPFNKAGEKVSRTNPQALVDSFYLKFGTGVFKAFNAMPLVKGNIRWVLRFATEELAYGTTYDLEQVSGNIYTAAGKPFSFYSITPLKVTVSDKPEDVAECSGHGTEVDSLCKCDKAYKGADCEVCDIGYYRTASGTCEEILDSFEIDQSAQVIGISPSKLTSLIQPESIFVTVELNQAGYTDEGLLIDGLSNSEVIQQAFVLQKGTSESFTMARAVKSLEKSGKRWSLEFNSKTLEPGKSYKLLQLENTLFTQNKKVFAKSEIEMPRFRVFSAIDCGNGKQELSSCVCPPGYHGNVCQICDNGYIKNLINECIIEPQVSISKDPTPFSVWNTLLYCIGYFALGMLIIYFVGRLRKPQEFQSEVELSSKHRQDTEEIDLYR